MWKNDYRSMKRGFPLRAQIKPSTHFKYAFLNRSHKTKISRSRSPPCGEKMSKNFLPLRCSYRASISADFYRKLFPIGGGVPSIELFDWNCSFRIYYWYNIQETNGTAGRYAEHPWLICVNDAWFYAEKPIRLKTSFFFYTGFTLWLKQF